MNLRGTPRTLLAALIVFGLEAAACDKLMKKDDATADTSDDDTPKKKKKKSDDDEAPSAQPSASAVATAEPTASASAEPSASAVASAAPTASASASATPAYSGEAMRYPDETQLPDEKRKVRNAAPARKETDHTSEIVVTLQPGNEVDQVAERHEFTLVKWKNKSGDHYGWVDTMEAFQDKSVAATPPAPKTSATAATSAHPPDIAGLARPTATIKAPPPPPPPTTASKRPAVPR